MRTPGWLLPALLKPAEKRVLDLLFDWPGVAPDDLRRLLGVSRGRFYEIVAPLSKAGLVRRVGMEGRRLALSDRGLALLARRDRTSVGAARKRWSVLAHRPKRSHRVAQRLRQEEPPTAQEPRSHGGGPRFRCGAGESSPALWVGDLAQLDPPMRAARHFRHRDRLRSVHPDAFGILRRGSTTWPFFLEWERRAVRPSTMAARLAPYLRYYSSHRPDDDHGAQPAVLVVFSDDIAATNFLRVAREQTAQARVAMPLLVSHEGLLEREGPLGRAWRTPDGWESVRPLPNS